jgi:hypothetical protein|uniref:Uncharacterized protein n=1 Tax=Siphoviridae sp. ctnNB1 TaxID=2825660 RepID=A0A8S5UVA5_9CAUD|nr:MAG TPA: hypothetical protein [Siphoviridae sp. ctnNB1]
MKLQTIKQNLPTNIEDISKFVLVGREKLIAVRAEIRAIEKVELAQEVRDQKRDEARMLSEALLDAEVKLGEMLKQIPRSVGGRPEKTKPTGGQSFQKPKHEIIKDLGFERHQAQRFEILADNPDLVEQVKVEARENDDLPTRTQVINLAKERARRAEVENEQIDKDAEVYDNYRKICNPIIDLESIRSDMEKRGAVCRMAQVTPDGLDSEIEYLTFRIQLLNDIRSYFLNTKLKGGK